MLTSILTASHNMRAFLPSAVQSVLRQSSTNYEHILLDDGSTDGTWDYLQSIVSFPRVRILRFETRQGLTACRNRLLQEARGEYLSILDADDKLSRDKIETHARYLDADKSVGVVWGRTLMVTFEEGMGRREIIPQKSFEPGWDILSPYLASHSATTWRKSAVVQAGGYDPKWVLVEGPDLFLKVGDFAKQIYCPRLAAIKRVFPRNEFRSALTPARRQSLSQAILRNTLERRRRLILATQ